MRHWYVVYTHAQAEDKVAFHLRNQGFGVYLPRYRKRRRHARRVDVVMAPLFPRYLFVELDINTQQWRSVHSTVGVGRLICHGDTPVAVPECLIDEIRTQEDESGILSLNQIRPFKKYQAVEFVSGPMVNQIGLFDCASDDERIFVLLDVLGRQIRIKTPLESVAACA